MPSIITWTRLEPRARGEDMTRSLQARIHDPLWLLTRQWQFGEFRGEDNASPVKATLVAEQTRLTHYHPGRAPTTFTRHGITDFEVQYRDGANWVTVPGGTVTGNNKVWVRMTFPDVTTDTIRIVVHGALNNFSRIVEVEAYQSPSAPPTADATVWVDDALPAGASAHADNDEWNWVTQNPPPFAGTAAHQSSLSAGLHQHFFEDATETLAVRPHDVLFAYVFLDPVHPPSEIMLQWKTDNWEHRAYWGANATGWGANGTASRRYIGLLPQAGRWVRLEVPARLVGMTDTVVTGMAFTLFDGRATWDRAGTSPLPTERVNVALAANGAMASASSTFGNEFPAGGAIDGDRTGINWGRGGGWNDATPGFYPDWLQVTFNGTTVINEISVITLQDDFEHPAEPVPSGAGTVQPYDSTGIPLETLVERERVLQAGQANWRLAVEAGLHFFRLLGATLTAKYRSAYLERYALARPAGEERQKLDGKSFRYLDVVAGRIPDGGKLYHDLKAAGPGVLPVEPVINAEDREEVTRAVAAWLAWYDTLFSEPQEGAGDAWVPERMEYEFAVAAPLGVPPLSPPSEVVLVAPEYVEGHLDWYSFNVDPVASLGATPAPGPTIPFSTLSDLDLTTLPEAMSGAPIFASTALPSPVAFGGMPATRWWEFEDARIDFGAAEAAPEDLARLLLVQFALIYGNDFFLIPVELPVGSLCRTHLLEVTNTFGEVTRIRPSGEGKQARGPWRMFHLSLDRRTGATVEPPAFLFLPPVLGTSLESPPVEEVLLMRDEMANLAWAIERLVESPVGQPLNRFEAYQEAAERRRRDAERVAAPPSAPSSGQLVYRLATGVPDYWVPLLPVHLPQGDSRAIGLERRALIPPRGRILEPGRPSLILNEEEVPRSGARVTRAYQYARWTDGSTHLWIGRRKRPGRGEGSSGLRFDVVEPE